MAEECVALCDYLGGEGELSFRKGEIITVLAKGTDSGFWEGISQGNEQRGLFPNCMVTSNLNAPRCAKIFLNKAVALFDYTARGSREMSFAKHDLITAVKPAESNPGWWWGVNETQRRSAAKRGALIFKNIAAVGSSFFDPEKPECQREQADEWLRLFPTNFVNSNIVVAAYPFQGRFRHELTVAVGDVIMVHRRWNDGWWEGSLPVSKDPEADPPPKAANGEAPIVVGGRRRGMFPSNYTLPNVPTTIPALFCPKCRTVHSAHSLSGNECKECNRNEEIVRTMVRTLQERDELVAQGEIDADDPVDLFEHIDLDPRKGPGSLLSASDVKDQTVRPVGSVPRTDSIK